MFTDPSTFDLIRFSSVVVTVYFTIKIWMVRISKVMQPVVEYIEQLAQDGLIDKADRRRIAQKALTILQDNKYVSLNFFERFLINRVIDYLAGKLPDFQITQDIKNIIDEAKKGAEEAKA